MNNVNRLLSQATAHKLRSAAAAILADASTLADANLRDALKAEADTITQRAESIEKQVKPEEPTETFSVVKARDKQNDDSGLFWTRVCGGWIDDKEGRFRAWHLLDAVEVLRVGIGDDEWHRLDVANAQTDAYTKGAEDMRAKVIENLREQLSAPVGYETQIAYRNAIRTVEDTRP